MKRVLLLLLVSLLVVGCVSRHPILGRWKTVDEDNHESVLFFQPENRFEVLSKGEKLTGTWTFNEEVQPHQLELLFEENRKIVTIAELEGDQLLIEPREEEAEMPTQFTENAQKYRRQ